MVQVCDDYILVASNSNTIVDILDFYLCRQSLVADRKTLF